MFIPLRPRIKLTRFPWLTLLISVICIAIYITQERNEEDIYSSAEQFCTPEVARTIEYGQKNYIRSDWKCPEVLTHIYLMGHTTNHLQWHLDTLRKHGGDAAADSLEEVYGQFILQVPHYITSWLWQARGSWNPMSMLTSVLSHGSWDHVLGNLFFFISFSLIVETVLGGALYLLVFFTMAFGIGIIDNLVHFDVETGPTLGLSGVVMGMLALAAFFAPKIKINYFYIVFIFPGVLSFPLWGIAIWYISWNVVDHLMFRDWSSINYVAHLGGALVGLTLGMTAFRTRRHWAEDLILDEPSLKDVDESWLARFRQITAAPVAMYLVMMTYLGVVIFFAYLLSLIALQLLMVSPILVASYYIYRSKKSSEPDRVRFSKAMQHMAANNFILGIPVLTALAEGGYTRAQIELARAHEQGKGVAKVDSLAAKWYRRAAESGNKEAQYSLGLMQVHGRTVSGDRKEPLRWFERAAKQGVAEAAMSLAHYHARGRSGRVEPELACDWYHRAGQLYLQQGRLEDVDVTAREIRSINPDYPHLPALEHAVAEIGKTDP